MKKFIELYTVHFISTNGITLTLEKPRVEATEDNLKRLEDCIKKGYLHVIEVESQEELIDMTPKKEDIEPLSEEFLQEHIPNAIRMPEYTDEELKAMNKKQLLEVAKEIGLSEVKPSMKVKEIEEIIKQAIK